ncbi:MAG TPA: HPr-rel-A system PqqD family peptide chaperone [Thioalkalivibrio sp.]|nr:HPr-rel-A system PqqD family peptide chaperone [Thioalkalivibrio sp.]
MFPGPQRHPLRTIPLPAAHLRQWGDELVVYDQRCGETHLLTGVVGELFTLLQTSPRRMDELIAHLQTGQHPDIDDPESFIQQVIVELRRLQLLDSDPLDSA